MGENGHGKRPRKTAHGVTFPFINKQCRLGFFFPGESSGDVRPPQLFTMNPMILFPSDTDGDYARLTGKARPWLWWVGFFTFQASLAALVIGFFLYYRNLIYYWNYNVPRLGVWRVCLG